MFKIFNRKGYPGELYQQFTKNNIILAGNAHIYAYKTILTKLGFSTIYEKTDLINSQEDRCVSIDANFLRKYELPKCL